MRPGWTRQRTAPLQQEQQRSAEAGTGTARKRQYRDRSHGLRISPLWIRDMCTRNIRSLLPMPAMKICLSFMRTTEPRSHVWLILMSSLMDGLTLTVTLKDGLNFASGNPITSAGCCLQHQPYQELKGKPVLYL